MSKQESDSNNNGTVELSAHLKRVKPTKLHENLKSLGEGKTEYAMLYNPTVLETFPNPQQEHEYLIEIEVPEFSCLCPKTGQPDFAKILISYSPDALCVESKSLKLYMFSFRQTGAFHEDVTNRIAKDLYDLMQPYWIQVSGQFFPRGGISFWPTVRLDREDMDATIEEDGSLEAGGGQ